LEGNLKGHSQTHRKEHNFIWLNLKVIAKNLDEKQIFHFEDICMLNID
jgi:hypothetical protein